MSFNWESALHQLHQLFKKKRAAVPYSCRDGIPPLIAVFRPEGVGYTARETQDFGWKNDDQKRIIMGLLSAVARQAHTPAIVVSSDTRWLNVEEFVRHFHLPAPEADYDAFVDTFHAILGRDYQGYMGNLPPHLFSEAVVSGIKGPLVPGMFFMTKYTCGPQDDILFEKTELAGGTTEYADMGMLPDWWDTTVQ